MITLDMNIRGENTELGQRYVAAGGPFVGRVFTVTQAYESHCLASQGDRTYCIDQHFFVASRSGGRDTTPKNMILIG